MIRLLLSAALVAAPPGPAPAPAPEDPVAAAIDTAGGLAAQGDMEGALKTVRDARLEVADPRLIYMEAQILRLTDDCTGAVGLYRAFIETNPPDLDRRYAEASIEECMDTIESVPVPPATAVHTSAAPPVAEPNPPQPEPAAAGHRPARAIRPGSIALWASGSVGVVAGAGMLAGAFSRRASATTGRLTLEDYQAQERRVAALGIGAGALMSVGTGLVIAGIVHHVVGRRRAQPRK